MNQRRAEPVKSNKLVIGKDDRRVSSPRSTSSKSNSSQRAARRSRNGEVSIESGEYTFPAKLGISNQMLGQGFDLEFNQRQNVYPNDFDTIETNKIKTYKRQIDNSFDLKGNANWIFASGSAGVSESKRYVILQYVNITKVVKLKKGKRIGDAPMYMSEIQYGHSANIIISGERSQFSAELAAKVKTVGIKAFSNLRDSPIDVSCKLVGLQARNTSPKIISSEHDLNSYTKSKPEPILVTYVLNNKVNVASWPPKRSLKPGSYQVTIKLKVFETKKGSSLTWDLGFGNKTKPEIQIEIPGGPSLMAKNSLDFQKSFQWEIKKDGVLPKLKVYDFDDTGSDYIGMIRQFRFSEIKDLNVFVPLSVNGQIEKAEIKIECLEGCNKL